MTVLIREERVRRVALLCIHFTRNLAYYRAGWENGKLYGENSEFWRTVNGSFLDVSILEWCKLFGDKMGEHYGEKIVHLLNC